MFYRRDGSPQQGRDRQDRFPSGNLVNNNWAPPPQFFKSVDSKGTLSCFRINTYGSVDSKGSYDYSETPGVSSLFAALPNCEKAKISCQSQTSRRPKPVVQSSARLRKWQKWKPEESYADLPEKNCIT